MSVEAKTPAPVPMDPREAITPAVPTRGDEAASAGGDTGGVPSARTAEGRRTPTRPDRVSGPHEPLDVQDADLEIVDPPGGVPAAIPPIPAEASGKSKSGRRKTLPGAAPAPGGASETVDASRRQRLRTPTPPPLPVIAMTTGPTAPMAFADGSNGDAGAPGLPVALPEALTGRVGRRKRGKPWFEEVFDEDYLRTLPFMTARQTIKETDFIQDALALEKGAEILDVGCGYGRHAIELSQRGYRVTGLDLSLPMLIRAADESQRRNLQVNFAHADMRELAFDGQFQGAYSMLTSFGYFDEETNTRVAEGIARALKPGGRFLIDTVNRDYIVNDLPTRVWWEGDGCIVLEEVDFNFHTSRLMVRRSIVFEDGRQLEHDLSIRAYSLHELGKLLRHAGFRVLDVSGAVSTRGRFFGATSRNLIVLCERRND